MIIIDTSDQKKWKTIEEKHKSWFIKEFEKKWKTHNSLYNNLSLEEKKYLKKLFNLDSDLSTPLEKYEILKLGDFVICSLSNKKISSFKKDYLKLINNRKINIYREIIKKANELNNNNKLKNKYNGLIKWLKEKGYDKKLSNDSFKKILENKNTKLNIIINKSMKPQLIELNFFWEEFFNYDKSSFTNINKKKWCRALWANELNIKVCPYCQRNYITNYHDEGGRSSQNRNKLRTTADLDHFYPKSEFPYLALSLYNFIPSCPICNSRFKLDNSSYDKKVLYPYKESFDDSIFKTKFTSSLKFVDTLINGKEDDFEVSLKSQSNVSIENKERIEKTINMFGLNEVYKTSHNKYLQNMLENNFRYPEVQAEYIADIFYLGTDNPEKKKEDINILKKSIEEIIKKPYQHKIEEGEPLGKLTKDILEEFGIKL